MAKETVETLGVKIDSLTDAVKTLASQFGNYTPSEVINLKFAEVQRDIIEIKKDIIELEEQINKSNWKTHTLTAILTFIMTFLTGFFLTTITKFGG